jgi:hypothetical protein
VHRVSTMDFWRKPQVVSQRSSVRGRHSSVASLGRTDD